MAKHLHFLLLFVLSTSLLSASSHFEGFDPEDQYDAVADDQYDVVDHHHHLRPPPLTHTDPPPSTATAPEPNPPPSDLPNAPSTVGSDYWDEDEFEGLPDQTLEQNSTTTTTTPDPKTKHRSTARIAPVLGPRSSYTVEIVCVSFLIVFVANYFAGKRRNEKLALAWASRFATRGSIFDKNFSLLGLDDDGSGSLLLKEGESVFKFYASGRRFCKGLLATIELKGRHDLMSRVWSVIVGRGDEIRFEVFMNDDAMDNVVFAVARKKVVKAMQKEERDLVRFGAAVSAPGGRKWVAEEVGVVSESKEVAGDLITDAVLDQVFGDKAFEKFGKGFISMHFSDQHIGTHKKMLVFKFALPDAKHMANMTRLVALVPYYIDLIGRYKLSPQARSKTEAARTKAAQEAYKESQNARQEALQKKKAEKRKIMEEAEEKFSAEAIRKREAKERSRHVKKAAPKVKMTRAH